MSHSEPAHPQQRRTHVPVRTLRIIGSQGDQLVNVSVYCALHERSVSLAECEACERFHALHFDAGTRATSVVCDCEAASPVLHEEAAPRDRFGGPAEPQTPLADIMTKTVISVHPETDLDDVMDLLERHSIGGVPVVDAFGRPIGVVSRADVLRARQERGDTEEMCAVTARPRGCDHTGIEPGCSINEPVPITASEVMSTVVFALHESANIGQGAALMAFEGVHRLPIVADRGEVVGILSAIDVLRWFGQRSGYLIPPQHPRE
jgi:CBS domain-containing protein